MVRNLQQYPITLQEKLDLIDQAIETARSGIGDAVGGVALEAWRQIRLDVTAQSIQRIRQEA